MRLGSYLPRGRRRMRALNVLIGALRADAQPMVTETNTCLLTGGRHRSRRQRLGMPARDLDMQVITAPVCAA